MLALHHRRSWPQDMAGTVDCGVRLAHNEDASDPEVWSVTSNIPFAMPQPAAPNLLELGGFKRFFGIIFICFHLGLTKCSVHVHSTKQIRVAALYAALIVFCSLCVA